tara:strand:+ start:632 stop:1051 length:420 start_codon:yes stop_codon:yes gene_type:complete
MKWLGLLVLLISNPLYAIPVVPNFSQGTSTSTTRTTTNIEERIKTIEFSGSTYSVSGSGVTADGNINPSYTNLQTTLNGQDYTWKQVDLNTRPNWNLNQNGASFQFTEVYKQPSVSRITDLTRTIQSESVTETTTVFSQ